MIYTRRWGDTSHALCSLTAALASFAVLAAAPAGAASALLESVKQNPQVAQNLCSQLRALNAQGVRSSSPQAVAMVAQSRNVSTQDAEVLTTYVVGLYCPDVR
ncbi:MULTISPECIES: hypothetical protein [unclassified Synechococcus]|uniref:hypothetical protein n=1 Tax=unclassified Synechococcus TaxID=2626047 RepID=UPI0020CBFE39|nr:MULTISPECIES: hypothetical protein [unclassified Synechococcus]